MRELLQKMHRERRKANLDFEAFPLQSGMGGDPWKILVACTLLRLADGRLTRKIIRDFFISTAVPEEVKSIRKMVDLFQPLGLAARRAASIAAFSALWDTDRWYKLTDLPGVGPYGVESVRMFALYDLSEEPTDHVLFSWWSAERARFRTLGAGTEAPVLGVLPEGG